MPNKKTIFIIAGEVSGDVLGANVMQAMPEYEFVGIGGQNMSKVGLKSIFPMSDLSVMGIIEVLAHARTLTRRINQTVQAILDVKPDLVLTIDSPGFARSVIAKLRKNISGQKLIANGLKFHHIVAPQVWAWRPGRAKKYAKTFDTLYSFFDFEIPYFTKYDLETVAVGHPIADNIMGKYSNSDNGVKGKKIVALMPGSRVTEVKKLMPIFHDFVMNIGDKYKFVIPTVETTDVFVQNEISKWEIKPDIISSQERYKLYEHTHIAIAASGTVSVELAMMHIPSIIVYRMNWLTTLIGHILLNVRWVSLVNILLHKSIYPELLGTKATAQNILQEFNNIVNNNDVRKQMIDELKSADKLWCPDSSSVGNRIAKEIKKSI